MTHLILNEELARTALKDKVVVLTGGATGIGRAAVEVFAGYGAKVLFGDVNDTVAESLVAELNTPAVHYRHCDTRSYTEQLALFEEAERLFGRVDVVCANAGVSRHKDIFLPEADWRVEPDMIEIDVNAKGCLYTVRIGMAYLRKNGRGGGDVVMTSSIAGWKECSTIAPYTASKHAVVGLGRGLYQQAWREGIRVNVVCPWMTKTRMVSGIEVGWRKLGLPENEPTDVARAMVICATVNRGQKGLSHQNATLPFVGKILHVGGGESYEIEDRIQALEPQWLGEENAKLLAKGQAFLADDSTSWDAEKSSAPSTGREG